MSRCDWTESFKRLIHSGTNQWDSKQWVVVIEPNHLNDWFTQERIYHKISQFAIIWIPARYVCVCHIENCVLCFAKRLIISVLVQIWCCLRRGESYESRAFGGWILAAVSAVNAVSLDQFISRRIRPEMIGRLRFRVLQSTGTDWKKQHHNIPITQRYAIKNIIHLLF